MMRSIRFPEAQASHRFGITTFRQHIQEFGEGLLPLPADEPIDIRRIENWVGIKASEVAAPYDGNVRMLCFDSLRQRNGTGKLWSRHHSERDRAHRIVRLALRCDMAADAGQIGRAHV